MSLLVYEESLEINIRNRSFDALIMAAMRRADTANIAKLKREWPELYEERKQRYNAPGGVLDGDDSEG